MTEDYAAFISGKLASSVPTGFDLEFDAPMLFPFQRDLVRWALSRGRAALFADTGLGKTRMQLHWAHHVQQHTGGRVLILAPLSVAKQTAAEGVACGVSVKRVSYGGEASEPGIYVTNYDKLHKFEPVPDSFGADFSAVVLDESSIIKHHDAKTLAVLLERFRDTPYKLCASATPSPNDYTELGTHAEFLGVCSRSEMLAEFFCHDGADTSVWRLKGHARQAFWRWVASWAAMLRRPSDLGYDDAGYDLPPRHVHEHRSEADQAKVRESGLLFAEPASTLTERRAARRATMGTHVAGVVDLVNRDEEQWVIWCKLNAEQDAIAKALGDWCVSIQGKDDAFTKELMHDQWLRGEKRILVTKSSIFGWGLNWQHCARMAFVGIDDSFESYYQATRRIWRFGQRRECHVHLFYNELEGDVLANLKRKGEDARKMGDELSAETRDVVASQVRGMRRDTNAYETRRIEMPEWLTQREAEYD